MSQSGYKGILDHMTFTDQRQLLLRSTSGDYFRCYEPPEPFSIRRRMSDIHETVFDLQSMQFREGAAQALIEIVTQCPTWRQECPQFALSAGNRTPNTEVQRLARLQRRGYQKMFVMAYEFTCGGRQHGCPSAVTVGISHHGSQVRVLIGCLSRWC